MASKRFEVAQERYNTLWPKSIYFSFGYYVHLMRYSELPADAFVRFGIKKQNRLPDEVRSSIIKKIDDAMISDLDHLYKNKHGLCTAWSILISHEVEEMEPAIRPFRFGDSGKHRLAFEDSGILIDSAPKTVVQLPVNGGSVSCGGFEYTVGNLESENPGLKYRTKGRLFLTEMCHGEEDALRRCLKQFLQQISTVVALFRTTEDEKLDFNGMIRWEKGSNVITWTDQDDDGTTVQKSAIFAPEGSPESRAICHNFLQKGWVQRTPSRVEQWDLIKDDFMLLWKALEKAFGLPKME